MHEQLTIRAETVLTSSDFNPLSFILYPIGSDEVPVTYSLSQHTLLYAYLQPLPIDERLIAYGQAVQSSIGHRTVPYLMALVDQIHEDFTVVYREVGPPLASATTFATREGSCRDLSWMLIALLRSQGFAARFTSGYFYFAMDEPSYELHAWVEVFLPGAGWVGLDPSHGIVTGNAHLPIASSSHYANTMPVTGGIRGDATSTLTTYLSIVEL